MIAYNISTGTLKADYHGIYFGFLYADNPDGNILKDNIMDMSGGVNMISCRKAVNTTWTMNLHHNNGTATYWNNLGCAEAGAGINKADPNLTQGTYIQRLQYKMWQIFDFDKFKFDLWDAVEIDE